MLFQLTVIVEKVDAFKEKYQKSYGELGGT